MDPHRWELCMKELQASFKKQPLPEYQVIDTSGSQNDNSNSELKQIDDEGSPNKPHDGIKDGASDLEELIN